MSLESTHPLDELSRNAPTYLEGCINNLKEIKSFPIINTTIQMLSFSINNDLLFHVMMTYHATPFGNKVSQICMAIHDFLCHHKFLCVLNLCHQYLSWHVIIFCVPWGFWSHEFTSMCMCTKQFIILVIIIIIWIVVLKKVTHNSLTF
jgi:hypothetical protein